MVKPLYCNNIKRACNYFATFLRRFLSSCCELFWCMFRLLFSIMMDWYWIQKLIPMYLKIWVFNRPVKEDITIIFLDAFSDVLQMFISFLFSTCFFFHRGRRIDVSPSYSYKCIMNNYWKFKRLKEFSFLIFIWNI